MAAKGKISKIPPEILKLYEDLLATHPEISRKGDVHPYTSLNGHMFTYLSQEGELGIRLSKEEIEKFAAKYKSKPFIQYGTVMKEYVNVPPELLNDTEELKQYLALSYDYIKTLKPKPTKKG